MTELKEIIRGCVCGDNSCYETIYNMFYPTVYGVCSRYSTTNEEMEDFIQESFIKIFNNIDKFDSTTEIANLKFGGWAKTISRNFCIDQVRKFKPTICEDYQTSKLSDEIETEYNDLKYNESYIIKAMTKLSPRYKTVFNMFYFDGLSHKQIADKLSIKEGASKANLYCAKKRLKNILTDNNELDY